MRRKPKPLLTMHLNPTVRDIFAFEYKDFSVEYPGLRECPLAQPKLLATKTVEKTTKVNPSPNPLPAPISV